MATGRDIAATMPAEGASAGKEPRTARGRKTLRAILDAAAAEFGEKGFHEGSISGITRRAGVALGSFYTYFDSKDDVFRALVRDMSEQVREHVAPVLKGAPGQIAAERAQMVEEAQRHAAQRAERERVREDAELTEGSDGERVKRKKKVGKRKKKDDFVAADDEDAGTGGGSDAGISESEAAPRITSCLPLLGRPRSPRPASWGGLCSRYLRSA